MTFRSISLFNGRLEFHCKVWSSRKLMEFSEVNSCSFYKKSHLFACSAKCLLPINMKHNCLYHWECKSQCFSFYSYFKLFILQIYLIKAVILIWPWPLSVLCNRFYIFWWEDALCHFKNCLLSCSERKMQFMFSKFLL